MKAPEFNFKLIIFNPDEESINFMHQGKLGLLTRLQYDSSSLWGARTPTYAFRPRNMEEFLEFLCKTRVDVTSEGASPDFVAYVDSLSVTRYKIAFDWIIGSFIKKQENVSTKEIDTFIRDCNKIRNQKIREFNLNEDENE